VLLTVILFFSTARAQMNDSGGGALGGGAGAGGYDPSNADGGSPNGAVGNTMRRGCVDPNDPNADESGLPPCTNSNSDSSDDSDQSSQGNPSTLSGGAAGMGGSSAIGAASAMRGAQGLGGAQGFSNSMNKQSMSAVIQQLGISPDELGSLKGQMASGGLSPDDMQELCLHFAAKQLSAGDVSGIAKSLGLTFTDQQLAQLRSCTGLAGQGGSDETATPAQQMGMTPQTSMSPANSNQPASSVESQFRGLDSAVAPAAPSTRNLQQFGYSLFSSRVSTFAPVANVPVSDYYVIGPGDQLKMLMWGRINNTINLTVGRDGAVSIPEIGPLQVAGLNFAQTKKLIEDHAGQITGVKVDVTMGKLKTIQVFVVGEVGQPAQG
jgi:hypothetical protein